MIEKTKRACKYGLTFAVAIFGVFCASAFYEFIARIFSHEGDELGKAVAIFYAASVFGVLKGFEKVYCACTDEYDYED
jgi:predicted membrane protein